MPFRFVKLLPLLLAFFAVLRPATAQSGSQGTVQLTVQDASGAVIPEAGLTLTKIDTQDTRTAKTSHKGDYSFVDLQTGLYSLTITKEGFATKVFDRVVVDAGQVDGLTAVLTLGSASETIRVTGEQSSLLETTSNQVGQVIDLKQVEDLPLQGRDLTAFSHLVAGYTGTFNGLPSIDSGNNIDGTQGTPSRAKYGTTGAQQASVSPRVEAIEQESIQTDQLDIASGFGQSTTQINYVTRRGGNKFHFRAYEDFRNSGLNAPSETVDIQNAASIAAGGTGVRKPKLILNDFGASAGGFIIRDKLFFFGTFATSRQPYSVPASNFILTPSAQSGNFTYTGSDKASHTVNVLQVGGNAGYQSSVNAAIAAQFSTINQNLAGAAVSASVDPNNASQVTFNVNSPIIRYFPGGRIDYNVSPKLRTYLSALVTTTTQSSGYSTPPFPGSGFSNQNAGYFTRNYIGTLGADYIFTPQLINQFKIGYLYAHNEYNYNAAPLYNSLPVVFYNFTNYFDTAGNKMSGQNYPLPVGNFYPLFSLSDSFTLQKGAHTIQFGFSGYREQDHYYNPPVGFDNINLGLTNTDPAATAFTNSTSTGTVPYASATQLAEAQQLYAVLTGRVSSLSGSYAYSNSAKQYIQAPGRYNLDELSKAFAFFAEDSYRIAPTVTLNYGLRWDFTFDNHDLTGAYHSALPDSIYGPTAQGQLFQPGALNGNQTPVLSALPHAYNSWFKSPQPAVGIAWNPHFESGAMKKFLGGSSGTDTVVRAGFSLRDFTEPYQFFWDAASDQGAFFYQSFAAAPGTTGKAGTYTPGSVVLGANGPIVAATGAAFSNLAISPATFQNTAPESQYTYVTGSPNVYGFTPNVRQPYTESWNLSLQRALGKSRVLEIRYAGNRSIHQWIQVNPNEVNIFENGFLGDFQRAQANLAANGNKSFSDVGRAQTPILDAAFGGAGSSYFTNTTYINYILNGQVGSLANLLAGNSNSTPLFFCNLVGTKFAPCASNAGYTTAGAGYPINFFQANPYSGGRGTLQLVDSGSSNYNGLQVEFRQGEWKGLQLNANYTYSKSLGISPAAANYLAQPAQIYTLRNLALSYGPSPFDETDVTHVSGTYDLPFGKGRSFLSHGGLLNRVVGGFNVGTILTFQTGTPFLLTGGFTTFNTADGGVVLNGITAKDLQKSVGVYRLPGQTTANLLGSQFINSATGAANTAYLAPNTTPGTIGQRIFLHGPHAFSDDIALTKSVPIKEGINFRLQGEFLNAFNHPVYGNTNGSTTSALQSTSFSRAGLTNQQTTGFGRIIELRANIEF